MKKNILFLLLLCLPTTAIIASDELMTDEDELSPGEDENETGATGSTPSEDDIENNELNKTQDQPVDTSKTPAEEVGSGKSGAGSTGAQATGSLSLATDATPSEEAPSTEITDSSSENEGGDFNLDDQLDLDQTGDNASPPETLESFAENASNNPTAADADALMALAEESATVDVDESEENKETNSTKKKSFLQTIADFFRSIGLTGIAVKIENWARELESNARFKQMYASVPALSSEQQTAIQNTTAISAKNALVIFDLDPSTLTRDQILDSYGDIVNDKYENPLIEGDSNSRLSKMICEINMTSEIISEEQQSAIEDGLESSKNALLEEYYPPQEQIDLINAVDSSPTLDEAKEILGIDEITSKTDLDEARNNEKLQRYVAEEQANGNLDPLQALNAAYETLYDDFVSNTDVSKINGAWAVLGFDFKTTFEEFAESEANYSSDGSATGSKVTDAYNRSLEIYTQRADTVQGAYDILGFSAPTIEYTSEVQNPIEATSQVDAALDTLKDRYDRIMNQTSDNQFAVNPAQQPEIQAVYDQAYETIQNSLNNTFDSYFSEMEDPTSIIDASEAFGLKEEYTLDDIAAVTEAIGDRFTSPEGRAAFEASESALVKSLEDYASFASGAADRIFNLDSIDYTAKEVQNSYEELKAKYDFTGSEPNEEFMKVVDLAFDVLSQKLPVSDMQSNVVLAAEQYTISNSDPQTLTGALQIAQIFDLPDNYTQQDIDNMITDTNSKYNAYDTEQASIGNQFNRAQVQIAFDTLEWSLTERTEPAAESDNPYDDL